MVYQRRSRVSTVFCPRHNNSVVRRWSCFPEMLKIARNKRRSSCRRTVGDRWSHRAIGISFADSYPRSYRCKRCRWDIGMDTPVVRRWILRDISKELLNISYSDDGSHVGRVCAFFDCYFAVIQHGLHMVHPVTITSTAAFLHHLNPEFSISYLSSRCLHTIWPFDADCIIPHRLATKILKNVNTTLKSLNFKENKNKEYY